MDGERQVVRQELKDVHERLVDDYELLESLCGRPSLSGPIIDAIAGLQYAVAKAAQLASRLHDNPSLWEPE